uniref:ATP synthase mitochondrial F1 complex assembly factor 1 n=2 Tax=Arion vulgaris TaxID=1028688 RepID=A0A0B6ZSV3_9EUPU
MPVICPKLSFMTRLCARCQLLNQHSFNRRSHERILSPAHTFSTTSTLSNEKSEGSSLEITDNHFFDKYRSKIQHMQSASPEEYEERIQKLSDRLIPKPSSQNKYASNQSSDAGVRLTQVIPPSDAARTGSGFTDSKSLDTMLKMELIQDKTSQEITQIWNQYHSGKDCVFTVLKTEEYQNLMVKAKECPVFVYPIRRDDGFEFILSQFDRNEVYFTPLGMFQLVRENAPPCLTVIHYTELMQDKGIVLMNGQFDQKVLNQQLALSLVQQMSIFYGRDSKYYDMVHRFNYQPVKFQYQELIDALKSLPQYDMK